VKSSKATSDTEKKPMVSDLNIIRMQMRAGDYACAVDVDPFSIGQRLVLIFTVLSAFRPEVRPCGEPNHCHT